MVKWQNGRMAVQQYGRMAVATAVWHTDRIAEWQNMEE